MKTKTGITYTYDYAGHTVEITRAHWYTAYPRNGNVGNPTEYFTWEARVDGELVTTRAPSRTVAYEYARCHVEGVSYRPDTAPGRPARNVRAWAVVADEMRANYRGRAAA